MSKFEEVKLGTEGAGVKYKELGSITIPALNKPSLASIQAEHPGLKGVVTDSTKLAYQKDGSTVADLKNVSIVLTDAKLPNYAMVDKKEGANPVVYLRNGAQITTAQKEDAAGAALAYALKGERSKLAA